MFKNVKKEDIVTVLTELGETVNIDMKMEDGRSETETANYAKKNRILECIFRLVGTSLKHKKVPEEFQAEIFLKLLGHKASNVLVYIKEEDLKDYAKVKALILKEFEPAPQACLENFRKAKRNSGETHIQFVSRLTSTWEYYFELRKVEDYESLKELIISYKLFQALDNDTASHICLKQGEKWLRPQELAKECDIYFGAKQKSFDEPRNVLRRTFSSKKYVPPHQRREISRRDNGILKRKECFVCGSLLHLARECPDKHKRNEFAPKQNDKNIHKNSNKNISANQEAVVAKVDSSHLQSESVQNLVTPLKTINIYIHSKEIEAIIDFGTQISIVHSSLIPDLQDQEGSKILLTPAFGGQIEAKICRVSIYYKNSGNNLFNNVDTLIAVTDKLNVPCLITPGIYELLVNSADDFSHQSSEGVGEEQLLEQPIEVRRSDVSPSTRTKPEISEVLENVDDVTSSTGATRLRKEQRSCRSLKEAFLQCKAKKENYSFIDGLLHHTGKILGQPVTQLVLPQNRRQQVLKLAHESVFGSHMGRRKTKERIRYSFYWPGLSQYVEIFC
ncbi:hypothetical protein AVEN_57696-1 [Araneus ventricosus]|uniref:CCHC-type domain-containing protein n=1 Tax=Araneus ventricosus TaxID=182803 RepID=A0A4Y2X3Z5_ARAVE|nr:hypothetical protein AVEN_57696-1 [Araneus ventricosus]